MLPLTILYFFTKIDSVEHSSWQAQIHGNKTWTLQPPPECYYKCAGFEDTVRAGEISRCFMSLLQSDHIQLFYDILFVFRHNLEGVKHCNYQISLNQQLHILIFSL